MKKEKDSNKNKENKSLTVKKEKKSSIGRGKWLRQTSLTVLLILIIVAICIGINIWVETINLTDFDVTEDKIYSLSDMSKQVAESIDKDVEIILVNMSESQEDFANKYNSVNERITVDVVNDVTSRPDLTDEYGISADNYVIIMCKDN